MKCPSPAAGFKPLIKFGDDILVQAGIAHPLAKSVLILAELEEVMFGFAFDGRRSGKNGQRINQIFGGVGGTAIFTRIAVLIFSLATRAGAANKSVRKKHAFLLVVRLFDCARINVAGFAKSGVHATDQFFVLGRMSGVKIVELDTKVVEVINEFLAIASGQLLGRDTKFSSLEHNRRAVCI